MGERVALAAERLQVTPRLEEEPRLKQHVDEGAAMLAGSMDKAREGRAKGRAGSAGLAGSSAR